LLIVKGLYREFQSRQVLCDISFMMEEGQCLAVMGPNGSGKSTLLKILSTEIFPSSGRCEIFGNCIVNKSEIVRELVGVVSTTDRGFYSNLTGQENLTFFSSMKNITQIQLKNKIAEISEYFPLLKDILTHRFINYSSGMKQILQITRALINSPKLLLLDEPTRALDEETKKNFITYLKFLREKKTSIVIATHFPEEAKELNANVIKLNNGRIL